AAGGPEPRGFIRAARRGALLAAGADPGPEEIFSTAPLAGGGAFLGFSRPLRVHMRVGFRRREAVVPQQFLDAAQIGAAVEQVGGETVAERVRRRQAVEPRLADVLFEEPSHAACGEPSAALVEKHGPLLNYGRGGVRRANFQPA